MKNITLLPIDAQNRDKLNMRADKLAANTGVVIDILEVSQDTIRLRIEHKVWRNTKLFNQKELAAKGRELFESLNSLLNLKLHYVTLTYNPEVSVVNADWIKHNMELYGLKNSDIEKQTGLDKSTISILLSEGRGLTKSQQVAFYYYFKVFEINASIEQFINLTQ